MKSIPRLLSVPFVLSLSLGLCVLFAGCDTDTAAPEPSPGEKTEALGPPVGPSHRYITENYAFAQTTPVYVLRNGRRYTSPEDAAFLRDVVDAVWQRVRERDQWHSEAGRKRYQSAVKEAWTTYQHIVEGGQPFGE